MAEETREIDLTRIEGFSDKVRWPRVGKVRLGVKNAKGLPVQTDYFVFDEEALADFPKIGKIFTDKQTGAIAPKALDVVLVSDDVAQAFPQAWKFYGKSRGLRCIGNGRQAMRYVCRKHKTFDCECEFPEVDRVPVSCTCPLAERGACEKRGSLFFLLPEITMEGVFQLDVKNTTIPRINSGLALVRAMLGRIALVPLKLRRVPVRQQAHGKMYTNHLVSIGYAGSLGEAQQLREAKGGAAVGFLTEADPTEAAAETDVVYDEVPGGAEETKETADDGPQTADDGPRTANDGPQTTDGGQRTGGTAPKKLTPDERRRGEKALRDFRDSNPHGRSGLERVFQENGIPMWTQIEMLTDKQLLAVGRSIREN